ncbi:MAG: S8 family peptidase [Gammaproteobacteria bacterium]|nr:S8 family peptidase [Gammaproteobacteria bacterium]
MAERPLLLFPQAIKQLPAKGRGFPPSRVNKPGVARQKDRLGPAFQKLEDAFEAKRAELSKLASGMEPEKVLVIETADAVSDFQRAVRSIPGMEWLGEFELDDMEPDENFRFADKPDKQIPQVLYLAMTNQRAIEEIVSLWNFWEADKQKFPRGKTKWRDLFSLCRTIRYWNTDDRLKETGLIDALQDILADAPQSVSMEIEFWHRSEARLRASKERVLSLLREADGEIVADAHIDEIGYSAIKASIPAELAGRIVGGHRPGFFNEDAVYCLRPEGQCVTSIPDSVESASVPDRPLPTEPPVVAILDGVPFQRHQYLVDRIELDDPDNFAGAYQAGEQKHGTAMVSLVIHGELNDVDASALNSKVYVRPVTAPDRTHVMPNQTAAEIIPSKELIVDFIHRAVKEIFERNDGKDFSTVKVVNVSLGDLSRPFSRTASPWARLLDWLSWKYQVLFCVSTGNYGDDVDLGIAPQNFAKLNDDDKSQKTLAAMAESLPNRRLLSPAESMNAITVVALHRDSVQKFDPKARVDIQPDDNLPSPVSRLGAGFRNSIKPDIFMPGGRQLYRNFTGQSAASHSAGTGRTDCTTYIRGTSGATALASRGAARIHEALREMQSENSGAIPDANLAVLMKALLVHGAAWGDAQYHIEILKQYAGPRNFKRYSVR